MDKFIDCLIEKFQFILFGFTIKYVKVLLTEVK